MRWMMLLLVGSALSGCADGGSDEEPMDHEAEHGGHGAMHQMANVTFFDAPYDAQEVISGAFDPQDHPQVQPALAITGQPFTNVKSHDVTDMIPQGVPVFVRLDIDAPPGTYTWLGSDDFAAVWTSDCGPCEGGTANVGSEWSGAVLNTGQSFTVNVWNNQGGFRSPNEYDVTIDVTAAPDRLPSGVVVEVDMPSIGSHILFESVDGDVPSVMVFDPDDAYVTTLDGGETAEMYIEQGMATGAYAFLPMGHGSFYKLRSGSNVEAGSELEVSARILTQIIQTTGPHPAAQAGSLSIDLPRQPLQTAILIFGGGTDRATAQTTGPEGFTLRTGVEGPVVGFGAFQQTPMGHDSLRPGTYTVSWEPGNNDGSIQVQEFFTLYGR